MDQESEKPAENPDDKKKSRPKDKEWVGTEITFPPGW
jgi:hypothetical protein